MSRSGKSRREGGGRRGREERPARGTERWTRRKPDARAAKKGLPIGPAGLVVLGLAVLTAALFAPVLLGGQTFVSPDATAPIGFVRVGEQALFEEGVYPLWNPFIFCGMPSFAGLAYNPFIYPPDWPLWLVQQVLPLPGLTWLVLYYFLGALGAYLLAREWGAGRAGAALAGSVFLFMPNLIAVGAHGHGSQLVDSAYLPWMLWLATRFFRTGNPIDLGWLALAAGFQLLRGHVQICYYTWLAVGLLGLFELTRGLGEARPPSVRARRVAGAGLALGLGFGLASFLYLPVQEYAKHSIRGGGEGGGVGYEYATAWSFSPLETTTFVVPGAVGFGGATYWGTMPFTDYPHYMGLGVLLLALVGVARFRRPWVIGFLGVLGLAALLTSFGKHGFLYPFLFDYLPYFNKFRVPVMILVELQLAVAVLAAFGVEAVLERPHDAGAAAGRTRAALLAATGIAALVLVAGLVPDLWRDAYEGLVRSRRPDFPVPNLEAAFRGAAGDALRVGFLALAALGAAVFSRRGTIPPVAFGVVLAITVIADLWLVDRRIMEPVLGPPSLVERQSGRDDVVDFLLQQESEQPFRILPIQEFQSNRFAGYALASLGGYHAAKPALSQEYIEAQAHLRPFQSVLQGGPWEGDGFLHAANVEYLVVPGLLPPAVPLELVHQGTQAVYRNPAALPRASLTRRYEVLPAERHLERLLSPGHDPRRAVLLDREPGFAPDPADTGSAGSVRIERYGLNRVTMETESPAPALLRFADLWFPGWTARVDGEPAEILRADFAFRAVVLPAGRHRVEWSYESRALGRGLLLAGAALAAVLALFAIGIWQRRRATAAV